MAKEIRFGCVACGKCCSGSTSFTIDEAIYYCDRAPIEVSIQVLKVTSKDAKRAGVRIARHYKNTFTKGRIDDQLKMMHASMSLVTPAEENCPLLTEDKLCQLHGPNQPLRCQNLPLSMPMYPIDDMREVKTFLCPDEAMSGDILISKGKVVNPEKRKSGQHEIDILQQDRAIFEVAMGWAWSSDIVDLGPVLRSQAIRPRKWLWHFSSALVMLTSAALGRVTYEEAARFCGHQKVLVRKASESRYFLAHEKEKLLGYASAHERAEKEFLAGDGDGLSDVNAYIDEQKRSKRKAKWGRQKFV